MHAFWEKRVRSNEARGHPFVAAKLPLQATGYLSLALPALHGSHKILHRLWICHLQSLLELPRINVAISQEFSIEAHQAFPGSPVFSYSQQVAQNKLNGWVIISNPVASCWKCSGEACLRQVPNTYHVNGFDISPIGTEEHPAAPPNHICIFR